MSTILVTGGAGFIGSALIRRIMVDGTHRVVNVDKLTYAADRVSLAEVEGQPGYAFAQVDIADQPALRGVFARHDPDAIVHLAAESHVDRSIDGPAPFIQTNVVGTFTLLQTALDHWRGLPPARRERFRFLSVSTDEVFGSLGPEGRFLEATPYAPRSPYAASKASADHLVRAWGHTYGLPVIVSNASNNYGPYQFPEKLIPLAIIKALAGEPVPVYGDGGNVRDWLHVDDHVDALLTILARAAPGETYLVGGDGERTNLQVVQRICGCLDTVAPHPRASSYRSLITFVEDRPGHDFRYAIDSSKLRRDLNWRPCETFETGLDRTVAWYLEHRAWWEAKRASGVYGGERLGRAGG